MSCTLPEQTATSRGIHDKRWITLPNELWSMILMDVPDLPSLMNLLKALPLLKPLFISQNQKILQEVWHRFPSVQCQKLASTILSLRSGSFVESVQHVLQASPDMPLKDAVSQELDALTESVVEVATCTLPPLQHPLQALRIIANLYSDTEYFTSLFFRYKCHRPADNVLTNQQPVPPPSPTELYRLHRALWRFWTLCHLACPNPHHTILLPSETHSITRLAAFELIDSLVDWEIEELECIYHFLREAYLALKRPFFTPPSPITDFEALSAAMRGPNADFKAQRPVVRRLLVAMGHDTRLPCPETLDGWGIVQGILDGVRCLPLRPWGISSYWNDAPLLALYPSEGWDCNARSRGGLLDPEGAYGREARWWWHVNREGPPMGLYRWGYCFWDLERLIEWDILEWRGERRIGARGGRWVQ